MLLLDWNRKCQYFEKTELINNNNDDNCCESVILVLEYTGIVIRNVASSKGPRRI